MKMLADTRVTQLKEHYGMENAGVYDPHGVGGTHVMYVLHDATQPELYGGLPANPRIPISFTVWKSFFKPPGLAAAMLSFFGVVFHYVFEGPRRIQPDLPIKSDGSAGKGD